MMGWSSKAGVLVPLCWLLACSSNGGDDQETAKKRLYQTGCNQTEQCDEGLVCKTEGSTSVCLMGCDGECEGGACEEGACVPLCLEGECPNGLTCDGESRCVPASLGGTDDSPDASAPQGELGCTNDDECDPSTGTFCTMNADLGGACTVMCGELGEECEVAGGECFDSSVGLLCQVPCPADGFESCPVLMGRTANGCAADLCEYRVSP